MVFSSSIFVFAFLPLTLIGYFVARSVRTRNIWLLLASLVFYAWGETFYIAILLVSIVINWLIGRRLGDARNAQSTTSPNATTRAVTKRRPLLAIGIVLNMALLGCYKYAGFIADNINSLLDSFGQGPIALEPVHLPLGISFFTFQAISYLVDVYRGHASPERRLTNVALYIALFPQLVAGPIVRFAAIQAQITARVITADGFAQGARRFIVGLAKKLLIANVLGETADTIFGLPETSLSASVAWLGVICYTLQIYFDFSGYSDMAIGLGRMFGFTFAENFNYPYISKSIQEFWRRWHISLSSWFRDYVYIPLGGSRKGPIRTSINLVTVFFLCGLWHGASWSFIVWGLFHGFFLVLERAVQLPAKNRIPPILVVILAHVYVLVVVMVGWVFFRADTLQGAMDHLGAMVGLADATGLNAHLATHLDPRTIVALVLGVILSAPVARRVLTFATGPLLAVRQLGRDFALGLLLLLSAMNIAAQTYNPFIYFRF